MAKSPNTHLKKQDIFDCILERMRVGLNTPQDAWLIDAERCIAELQKENLTVKQINIIYDMVVALLNTADRPSKSKREIYK